MYVIYLRQLHEYLTSFRAQIGFAVVITFFLLSGVLSALRITQTQLDDAESQRNVAAKLASVETVQQGARTTLQARNSPTATEFMSEGGLHWFWGTVSTTAESGRNMGFGQARSRNYWMGSFERLDWTFIVRLIFSFLCVVLAYDSISGEAERGTLRLMLTCPISRIRVAVAKYGAQLTVLGVLFTIGSMMSLVILMLMGSVQLSWTLVWKYFLYEAAVLVFLSQFLWFAIGISALVARSSSALVLLSLVWTSANIILPQSAYLLAMQTVEVPNRMRDAPSVYVRDVRQSLVASGGGLRDPIVAITDDYVIERRYARLVNEAEQEADQLRQLWLHRLMDRYAAARAITLLSPAYAFQ